MIKVSISGSTRKMLEKNYADICENMDAIYRRWYSTPFSWIKDPANFRMAALIVVIFFIPISLICIANDISVSGIPVVIAISIVAGFLTKSLVFNFTSRRTFIETKNDMDCMTYDQYSDYILMNPSRSHPYWSDVIQMLDKMTILTEAYKVLAVTKMDDRSIEVAYTAKDGIVNRLVFHDVEYIEKLGQEDTELTLELDDMGNHLLVCIAPFTQH